MKNKLTSLLKATGIMVAFIIAALIIGMLTEWSYYLHLSIVIITIVLGIYYFYRQMRPKWKCYFVSFSHETGFWCTRLKTQEIFDIVEMGKYISNTHFAGEATVSILYYKEISEEEYKSNQL